MSWSARRRSRRRLASEAGVGECERVEGAKRVVDLAMDVSGRHRNVQDKRVGTAVRDVRCGGFHPANSAIAHESFGKTRRSASLTETIRW